MSSIPRFRFLRRSLLMAGTVFLATVVVPAWARPAPDPLDAMAATKDLYKRISARDSGVLRYLPAGGFSEIDDGSEPRRIDAAAFKALFASPLRIDLHAEDLHASVIGDVVLVTGFRVGSMTPPDHVPKAERSAFSMLWTRQAGQWQLRHVHLSTATAAP